MTSESSDLENYQRLNVIQSHETWKLNTKLTFVVLPCQHLYHTFEVYRWLSMAPSWPEGFSIRLPRHPWIIEEKRKCYEIVNFAVYYRNTVYMVYEKISWPEMMCSSVLSHNNICYYCCVILYFFFCAFPIPFVYWMAVDSRMELLKELRLSWPKQHGFLVYWINKFE